MQWFALLGRELALCQAELVARTSAPLTWAGSFAVGEGEPPNWDQLGGTLRGGYLVGKLERKDTSSLLALVQQALPTAHIGKLQIGLSWVGASTAQRLRLGKQLKQVARDTLGLNIRLIYPKDGHVLNAAQVLHNKLTRDGNLELMLFPQGDQLMIAKSTWCQDIDAYAARDRGRPARDARVGMLPPKLAQMMLSLAGVDASSWVHDPFCGTGVVLQEALLLGARVSGSDLEPRMVAATEKNLRWLASRTPDNKELQRWQVSQGDALHITLNPQVTHVVAEGLLGNANLNPADNQSLEAEAAALTQLYRKFLRALSEHASALIILLALPEWHAKNGAVITLSILDDIKKLGYTTEQFAPSQEVALSYHRHHQTVGRTIIKLTKSSRES